MNKKTKEETIKSDLSDRIREDGRTRGAERPRGNPKAYTPSSNTTIPPQLEQKFAEDGYALRWIRVKNPDGSVDNQSLYKRMHGDGFKFVTEDDLADSGFLSSIVVNDLTETYQGILTRGDLGLAMISFEDQANRNAYYEDEVRKTERAVEENLRQNAPGVEHKSTTRVSHTRPVSFGK